ncbi:acetolactate decarboxylase [Spongiivirga sp. MCCC 1A20706]|uniref:acetolactate decarboxylase n=1 Tax=Spongiivirga sp. MCCC 1A20706 TaxID=3160963 RepID=UPI00397773C3
MTSGKSTYQITLKSTLKYILGISLLLFASCKEVQHPSYQKATHSGALRTIMSGDLSATASLDTLAAKDHLYALGAVSQLKGEIQIFDGVPFISNVNKNNIAIDPTFSRKAALLVYAVVPSWKEIKIPATINTQEALEAFIIDKAASLKIDTSAPFPFLIEGNASSLSWHIIDWPEGDTEHTHQKHKESGLNGDLTDTEVSVLGFYSDKHKGVFTHHSTNFHMHFKTKDGQLAGHLDGFTPGSKMRLKLPKQYSY